MVRESNESFGTPLARSGGALKYFFTHDPKWWVRDIVVGLVLASAVAGATVWAQTGIEERQREAEQRLANSVALQNERAANRLYVYTMSSNRVVNAAFDAMDLTEQSLSGVQVPGASFRTANLRSAFLARSDLRGADFWDAEWDDAIFVGTDLRGAHFGAQGLSSSDDDVPVASFMGANLMHSKLMGMRLTDIRGARLVGAQLLGVDLSDASADVIRENVADGLFEGVCYDDRTVWPADLMPHEIPPSTDIDQCAVKWEAAFFEFRPISQCGDIGEEPPGTPGSNGAIEQKRIQVCPTG